MNKRTVSDNNLNTSIDSSSTCSSDSEIAYHNQLKVSI